MSVTFWLPPPWSKSRFFFGHRQIVRCFILIIFGYSICISIFRYSKTYFYVSEQSASFSPLRKKHIFSCGQGADRPPPHLRTCPQLLFFLRLPIVWFYKFICILCSFLLNTIIPPILPLMYKWKNNHKCE